MLDGYGCQPGLHHYPVHPGPVQFGQRALVCGPVLQGEAVPEGAEALLLVTGDDAIAHGGGYALFPPFLEGVFNIFVGGAGALGDGRQGLPEDCLVEGVVRGGVGHERYHLLPALPVGLSAFRVVALEGACLLAPVAAGAGEGLE